MYRSGTKIASMTIGGLLLVSCSDPVPLYPLFHNQDWQSRIELRALYGGSGLEGEANQSDDKGNAYLSFNYTFEQTSPPTEIALIRDQLIAYFDEKSSLPVTWTIPSALRANGTYSDELVTGEIGITIEQLDKGRVQVLTACQQRAKEASSPNQ